MSFVFLCDSGRSWEKIWKIKEHVENKTRLIMIQKQNKLQNNEQRRTENLNYPVTFRPDQGHNLDVSSEWSTMCHCLPAKGVFPSFFWFQYLWIIFIKHCRPCVCISGEIPSLAVCWVLINDLALLQTIHLVLL